MNKIDEKIIEKAKKLLLLAEQGVGGEKVNAEKFLHRLLAKHGIKISDLNDTKTEEFRIKIKGKKLHTKLLAQICYSVNPDVALFSTRGNRSAFVIESTKSDFIEIELKYTIYAKAFDEQLSTLSNDFYLAFIQKNKIFPTKKKESDKVATRPSEAEREKMQRVMSLADGIEVTPVNKAIES
ncbi:hypothetical protein JCM30760_26480 [Thiomicrorhabdus hydrogeniphila]